MAPVAFAVHGVCGSFGVLCVGIFSDGAYEVSRPDGSMLESHAFEEVLTRPVVKGESELDRLLHFAREFHGAEVLDDDFSIIEMTV